MKPEHWALLGVVVGATLGAGAQILAGWLGERRERARELRSTKREVYSEFIDAVTDHVVFVGQVLWARALGVSPVGSGADPESLPRLTKAHARVLLHGSADVQRATGAFRHFLNTVESTEIRLPRARHDALMEALASEVGKTMHDAQTHHASCLRAMRKDLGIDGELVEFDLLKVIVAGAKSEGGRRGGRG